MNRSHEDARYDAAKSEFVPRAGVCDESNGGCDLRDMISCEGRDVHGVRWMVQCWMKKDGREKNGLTLKKSHGQSFAKQTIASSFRPSSFHDPTNNDIDIIEAIGTEPSM